MRAASVAGNTRKFSAQGPPAAIPISLTRGKADTIKAKAVTLTFGGIVNSAEAAPAVFNGRPCAEAFTPLTIATPAQAFDGAAFTCAPAPNHDQLDVVILPDSRAIGACCL